MKTEKGYGSDKRGARGAAAPTQADVARALGQGHPKSAPVEISGSTTRITPTFGPRETGPYAQPKK